MREFLEWIASRPRTYAEAMEAWRSHCPRYTVWEDALAGGLIQIEGGGPRGPAGVTLTPKGRLILGGEASGRPAPYLDESFAGPGLNPALRWHSEPARWSIPPERGCLRIEPEAKTDFWQRTHYGFEADNGHFLFTEVAGDFVLTAHVRFWPVHQYDQAGVMVRTSSACWLKASVEYEPAGPSRLGAVVTNHGYSDWSTQGYAAGPGEIWLRVRREGDDYVVEAASDGKGWEQIRLAHLHEGRGLAVAAGLYACSPKQVGFRAEFGQLRIELGRIG
jgi:regulation of enolase protein 1 (concanavalin A-like superfamily)